MQFVRRARCNQTGTDSKSDALSEQQRKLGLHACMQRQMFLAVATQL